MIQSDTERAGLGLRSPEGADVAAEMRVLAAARIWLVDRAPGDTTEKALAAAIARAWPEECGGKEGCPCGDSENCDECPSAAEVEAIVSKWERESSDLVPNQFTRTPDFSASDATAVSR